jgi:hypothetical protein
MVRLFMILQSLLIAARQCGRHAVFVILQSSLNAAKQCDRHALKPLNLSTPQTTAA